MTALLVTIYTLPAPPAWAVRPHGPGQAAWARPGRMGQARLGQGLRGLPLWHTHTPGVLGHTSSPLLLLMRSTILTSALIASLPYGMSHVVCLAVSQGPGPKRTWSLPFPPFVHSAARPRARPFRQHRYADSSSPQRNHQPQLTLIILIVWNTSAYLVRPERPETDFSPPFNSSRQICPLDVLFYKEHETISTSLIRRDKHSFLGSSIHPLAHSGAPNSSVRS